MKIDLALIERDEPVSVAGLFNLLIRKFGQEVSSAVAQYFKAQGTVNWFDMVNQPNPATGLRPYLEENDPRFLLAELSKYSSPLQLAFHLWDAEIRQGVRDLKTRVNLWQHFTVPPTAEKLLDITHDLLFVCTYLGLPVTAFVSDLKSRLQDIISGNYVASEFSTQPKLDPTASRYAQEVEKKIEEVKNRPPIGGDWVGVPQGRQIKINHKLNDVLENGVSIRNELGPNPDQKIRDFIRYYPRGGEATIESDGAVCGYKHGVPKLIGYIGEKTVKVDGKPEGFVLSQTYIFTGSDVRDVVSNKLLSHVASESVKAIIATLATSFSYEDFFYVTAHGEVLANQDEQSTVVATVHPGIWFPGHLPEGFRGQPE